MNFKLLISIFFICFFSASCAGKKVKTQTKTKPTISIETAELRTSMKNPHQGFIVIDMQLKNSSQLNVSCQNYELKPTLSGTKVELKEVQNNVDFKLSAGETANLPLMVPLSQNLVEFDPKSDQERPSFNAKFNGKLKCGAQTVVLDFENEFIIPEIRKRLKESK